MKAKKNFIARLVAGFALFAIILGIVGTGILVIFQSIFSNTTPELTQEQLQEYINSLSGTTLSGGTSPELSPSITTGTGS